MTNTVLIKRSGVADSVPGAGNLSLGELAINYIDGNLFYKNSSNVVTVIASNKFLSVTGNVTGSQFNGSGAGLTSIPGANVTGTLSIPTTSYAATVSGAAQSNITSVGTLTSLSVTGNINSAGNLLITNNVGVGTTTPASYGKFAVFGTQPVASVGNVSGFFSDGATVSLYVTNQSAVATLRSDGTLAFGSGSSVTERMRITTTGSVGIGTITPTTTLDVEGGTRTYGIANFDGATFFAQDFKVAGTHKGYLASANAVITGGSVDDIALDASVGNLILATGDAEKVRITSSGNVGIGLTNPSVRLDVVGASNVSAAIIKAQGALPDNNDNAGLYVLHQGTTGAGLRVRTDAALTGSNFAHILVNNASASINGLQVSQYGTGYIASFDKSGTVAMRIDSSGNVGIGTTSPSAKLDVRSAALGTALQLSDDTNYGANFIGVSGGLKLAMNGSQTFAIWQDVNTRLTMASTGYFGIQNTAPAAPLHVGPLIGTGSLNGYTRFALESTDYAVATWKSPAANFSQIIFTDTTTTSLGGINYFNSTNATPNAMAFLTAGSERMRITSSGNVGIGTASPGQKLTLESGYVQTGNGIGGAGGVWFPYGGDAGTRTWRARTDHTAYGDWGIEQSTTQTGTTFATRLLIDPNGNVGIGTSSPIRKLTVSSAGAVEFVLQDTSQAADSRNWRIFNTVNTLYFGTLNDAGTAGTDAVKITSGADLQFNSGYGSVATAYGCRAWVSFDANTATVRGSANISSISYVDVGRYNINFSTAMPDANYAVTTGVSKNGGGASGSNSVWASSAEGRSTTYFLIELWNLNNSYVNVSNVFAAVFR